MDKCCTDVDVGGSYKSLIDKWLRIGVVGASVKNFTIIDPITLLSYLTKYAYTSPRLLAIIPQCRIIFVPMFTIFNKSLIY